MGFLARLLGGGKLGRDANLMVIKARCARCGEEVQTFINLSNDLSPLEDEEGFFTNKVLIGKGDQLCFQRIEIHLEFDKNRVLKGRSITGGEFIGL
jgi:hypothetical protein